MFAVIGGSGFYSLPELINARIVECDTPYGLVSELHSGEINGVEALFLPRHGGSHKLPPHKINYRANLWALRQNGVDSIVAINAVGGITADAAPGVLVIPDQIIDYTSGREHTFADSISEQFNHVDFTFPYSSQLRQDAVEILQALKLNYVDGGVYGCCQGPRLETAAEIKRLERDGCTIVGMTGMPEAALARELGMNYVCIAAVVNWAAGKSKDIIHLTEIEALLRNLNPSLRQLVSALLSRTL